MKKLCEMTIEDILDMDYNNLISVVRETNRVPGGYATIQEAVSAAGICVTTKLLEIGTSTGITAIELVRLTGCSIESIDINERSIEEARCRAEKENLDHRISFSVQDARKTAFEDQSFEVVFCGNVTSLIPQKELAKEEYFRVLKHGGFLIAVPMYYIKQPSTDLIDRVSKAIKTEVQLLDKSYWLGFYKHPHMCLKYVRDYKFNYIDDKTLEEFISYILSKPHLKEMKQEVFDVLKERYREYIYLFRDNLSHMGYSIVLMSKELYNDEPELFVGSPV